MGITQDPDNAILELNHRFQEHGIGYQYVDGEIMRVDSQFAHQEIIKPALSLLQNESFSGAEEEFLKAHEHYRHQRHKEALNEALKAAESIMKAICDRKKWDYPANATARGLTEVIFKNELIPPQLQAHFSGLRAVLESGIPTVRNSTSGHGQGSQPIEVPSYVVAFGINTAASAIALLAQAYQNSK